MTINHFIDLAVLDNARFAIIKFDIEQLLVYHRHRVYHDPAPKFIVNNTVIHSENAYFRIFLDERFLYIPSHCNRRKLYPPSLNLLRDVDRQNIFSHECITESILCCRSKIPSTVCAMLIGIQKAADGFPCNAVIVIVSKNRFKPQGIHQIMTIFMSDYINSG